jgi:hypothetical protein
VNRQDRGEGISDPLLAAAMEELRDEVPHEVDWERLRTTINDRAALSLARRRAPRRTFASRSFATVALAAGVAFALWIGPEVYQDLFQPEVTTQYVNAVDEEVLVEALTGDLSEQELLRLVSGSPEVLLAVAIGSR